MSPLEKRWLFATVCAAILIMPAGCAGVSPGSFCTLYQPVYTASSDTVATRDAVDMNNALWLDLCVIEPYAP